jgi:hypothetical protein
MAAGVTGVKKLTRLPSGSRSRSDLLPPYGLIVPSVLASLDLPFVIERPDELRGLVIGLAERLAASAAAHAPA